MTKRFGFLAAAILCWSMTGHAATLTVTTDADEANCNQSADNTKPCYIDTATASNPLSTGCSLREALQDIADAAGGSPLSFPECGTPDVAPTGNTIVLGAHTIDIYSQVPDPTDATGVATTHNTQLPFVPSQTTAGPVAITGGTISCEYDPQALPPVGGNSIFTTTNNASLQFQGTHFQNCTSPSDGVAIVNSGNTLGDLTLTGVTFTNIRAVNQGNGGCIAHGSGNLVITGGSFTTCVVDDGGVVPGGGGGNGGAIYMGAAGGTARVAISGVTFQANVAGNNGGAIYMSNTDAIAIDTSTFQANVANGSTFSSGNAELGGGAIYATGTATGSNDGSQPGVNASAFLIFQTSFIANTALQGTGGAILLTGDGKLTYGTLTLNFDGYKLGTVGSIPGGVVASNFSGNLASGTWDTVNNGTLDPRAGSGGAIFAHGTLSVLASSFVGANTSTSANGGAIAYHDPSASYVPLAVTNTTFNGNKAGGTGGAISNFIGKFTSGSGKVTLINDTIDGNSATGAGGGFFNANTTASEVNVANTILSNNTGSGGNENCGGQAFTDGGGNLQFNPAATCGAITVGDPQLDAPTVFGGVNALVLVEKLGASSAAQGAGVQTACDASPVNNYDEALNTRPAGKPNCDSGAYESSALTPVRLQSFVVE